MPALFYQPLQAARIQRFTAVSHPSPVLHPAVRKTAALAKRMKLAASGSKYIANHDPPAPSAANSELGCDLSACSATEEDDYLRRSNWSSRFLNHEVLRIMRCLRARRDTSSRHRSGWRRRSAIYARPV